MGDGNEIGIGFGRGEGDVLLHIALAGRAGNLERLIVIRITVPSSSAGVEGEPLPAVSSGDEIRAEWHSSSRMLRPALHWRLWEGMMLLMRIYPNRGFCRRHGPNRDSVDIDASSGSLSAFGLVGRMAFGQIFDITKQRKTIALILRDAWYCTEVRSV